MEKIKKKIKQFLCKHKNTGWYSEQDKSKFQCISGERRYEICEDCGKEVSSYFHKY